MSADNDNPLARWSRRKQVARSGKTHARPQAEQPAEPPPPPIAEVEPDALPLPLRHDEQEPQAAEPAELLPDLDDLTAGSDLSAFLKKGVPLALKSAALRRMWSLDPAIRDYVGPSEYAWDFNKPGSMAGFGPLDPKKAVVDFLSKTTRILDAATEPKVATQQPASPFHQTATTHPTACAEDENSELPTDAEPPEAAPPNGSAETVRISESERFDTEDTAKETTGSQLSEVTIRPHHGGAMPH